MEADPLPEDVAMLQVMVRELLASKAALSARALKLEGRLGLHSQNSSLPPIDKTIITQIYQKYDAILATAKQTLPPIPPKPVGKRGRIRKAKEQNLFERLQKFKAQALAFVNDFRIPFDNNSAERSIRMLNVVQKINGGWRTLYGAKIHLAFKTFLDTARKKGQNLLHALQNILKAPKLYILAE